MKTIPYLSLLFLTVAQASPALYEGFDFSGSPKKPLAAQQTRSGESSSGWMSDWQQQQGTSRALPDDLNIDGLTSRPGLIVSKGKAVAMRQMSETFVGDTYGSFRVRGAKINDNSMMGLLFSLPGEEDLNPKTALLGFLPMRWASPLGSVSVGKKIFKIEEGEGLKPNQKGLVLWKIENLPEPGKRSDQVIQMWVLNESQVAHFASKGMPEVAISKAKSGVDAGQVLQSIRVPLKGSKLTLVKGLVISCFSYGVPGAFDEIRISRKSLADAAGVNKEAEVSAVDEDDGFTVVDTMPRKHSDGPNILFITMDDMNWDSIGSYGCPIPGISPHIDSLADSGMRFEYAYNQTSSCVPSRTTYQTGRYPHTSGVLSFYNVDADYKMLPELLRSEGYFTAVVNKPRDTSITDEYDKYWDYHKILKGAEKRGGETYSTEFTKVLNEAKKAKQPFYCVVNIGDPHKPFFNDDESIKQGYDKFAPSKVFSVEDVPLPGFLPDLPEIREEMRNYYNSVKRGDDCVGAVLDTLEKQGLRDDTVIIFISDHGMPLPFAKSSLYADGLRTPWIVSWPAKLNGGRVDSEHLVSAIDLMPTVLDIAKVDHPSGLQGKSVLPVINGGVVDGLDRVYAEFNDNAGGLSFPMRAVHTKRYAYIFNAWGTGNHSFSSAATWHTSENVMKRVSKTDPVVADRYNFLLHRSVEELYDLEKDPFSLVNRIDDPDYKDVADSMRKDLEAQMRETNDYVLEAFLVRDDSAKLDAFMAKADAAALKRAETLQWKRYKNRAGGTGKNVELYRN